MFSLVSVRQSTIKASEVTALISEALTGRFFSHPTTEMWTWRKHYVIHGSIADTGFLNRIDVEKLPRENLIKIRFDIYDSAEGKVKYFKEIHLPSRLLTSEIVLDRVEEIYKDYLTKRNVAVKSHVQPVIT